MENGQSVFFISPHLPYVFGHVSPGGVLPYKGLMGTCGHPGYVFRDFCLKQGIEFIIFCLNQGIDLSIFVLNRISVLNRVSKIGIRIGIKNRKQGRKISDICLRQGQGMRGRAAPPHSGIYRVPPPGFCRWLVKTRQTPCTLPWGGGGWSRFILIRVSMHLHHQVHTLWYLTVFITTRTLKRK